MTKLDFGSGVAQRAGYKTIDRDISVGADICIDLEVAVNWYRLNYADRVREFVDWNAGKVDEIRCHHFLEHVDPKKKVGMMRLIYWLLKPGGIVDIEVPNFPHPASVQDPTHISFWNKESFWYFIKGNKFGEAFSKRCHCDYQFPKKSPLFEFVSDNKRTTTGQTLHWAYGIVLKRPENDG